MAPAYPVHAVIQGLNDPSGIGVGPSETVQWTFFHRLQVPATANTTTRFFTGLSNASRFVSNWPFGDNRMSKGNAFAVFGIGLGFSNYVEDQSAAAAGDATNQRVADLTNNASFSLKVEGKNYVGNPTGDPGGLPLTRMASGGGLYVTPRSTTAGGNNAAEHIQIGFPSARLGYTLSPGVLIGELYQFQAELRVDAALGAAVNVVFYMVGLWTRPVQ